MGDTLAVLSQLAAEASEYAWFQQEAVDEALTHVESLLREGSGATDARPIVYFSTSEGLIPDVAIYAPDGRPTDYDSLPVRVIQIDWNEVSEADDPEENYECGYVRDLIADETLPDRIRNDLRTDYEHCRRFDDLDS